MFLGDHGETTESDLYSLI